MIAVAVLDDYQGIARSLADWDRLPAGSRVDFYTDHLDDEDAVARRLAAYEAVVVMRERTPLRRSLLERLPNLKLIVTTGARNASIDVVAARERGITVCATNGIHAPTVELTWALILALVRNVPFEDRAVREGRWQSTIGPNLEGKVLGCVGLGNLGSRVARIGLAFGMEVVAWSQNLTEERAAAVGARLVAKDELMATADVVTVHLVLSDRSRGLIGAADLARMKPTAYLVNTSRGPIVDEEALAAALANRQIAGAALDVFSVEPLPADHPFRRLPNTVVTPHIGYVTTDNYRVYYGDAVEDILAFLKGEPVRVIS